MSTLVVTERGDAGCRLEVQVPQFAGRAQELAVITSALAAPPALVLVEGEAGKTRTPTTRIRVRE